MPGADDPGFDRSTAAASAPPSRPPAAGREAIWRRLLRCACLPLGLFLLFEVWSARSGAARFEAFLASLTGRADGAVAAVGWRLEPPHAPPDPAVPLHQGLLRTLAFRLELDPTGAAPTAVELQATGPAEEIVGWPWGPPQPLERILGVTPADPVSGLPRLELLLSRQLLDELAARRAATRPLAAIAGGEPDAPGSELDALRLEVDRPLEALASLWMRPAGNRPIRVHFDPRDPAIALPEVTLGSGWTERFFRVSLLVLLGGGLGLALLVVAGKCLAPSLPGWARLALSLGVALSVPLWGPPLERATPGILHPAGDPETWATLGPIRLPPREAAPHDTLVFDFPTSRYAATLARFRFSRPQAVAGTRETAWREVVAQLTAQSARLADDDALGLIAELGEQLRAGRRDLSVGLLAAVRDLSLATRRPERLRAAARDLLVSQLAAGAVPRATDFAPRAALADFTPLAGHPDPAVAAAARRRLAELARLGLRP